MRRVVVHIGLEKAASTSLQAQLVAARDDMRATGIVFPQLGGGGVKDQQDLRFALSSDSQARARTLAALHDAKREGETLILSGETIYQAAPSALLELLADAGWGGASVRAVAVVREPASWLNSRYAFHAFLFRQRRSFRAFVTHSLRRQRVSLMRAFSPWLAAPDIEFEAVPLSAVGANSVIARALQAMALSHVVAGNAQSLNEAVDPRTVEAARRLSAYGIPARGRQAVRRARKTMLKAAAEEGFHGRFEGLDAKLRARIAAATASDLDDFAMAAWGGPWRAHYAQKAPKTLSSNEWLRQRGSDTDGAAIARVVDAVRLKHRLKGGLLTRLGWRDGLRQKG